MLVALPQVDDRVEEAAAFISVLDDLQPIDRRRVNLFVEVCMACILNTHLHGACVRMLN